MKKTLIALAVGSAFAAPAAFADVTISGSINMGIEYHNVGESSDDAKAALAAGEPQFNGARNAFDGGTSNFGLAANYTNITISSMEDLGGGLKLDFAAQIDWNTTKTSGLNNRNSHIGLVGESWGGVWYGTNENIYERYFYTIDPLDGAAGMGGNLSILGTPGGEVFGTCTQSSKSDCGYTWYRRDAQSIWYDSPNWNGFTFGAVVQTNYAKNVDGEINPNMFQFGAKYVGTSLPLELWGAFATRKDQFGLVNAGLTTDGGSSKDTAWHVGAAYTLGDIKIFGGYEDIKYKVDDVALATDVSEYSRAAWYVGAKWNLATGYVGAQFIQALEGEAQQGGVGETEDVDDSGAYMFSAGYYHNLSKQTQAYVVGMYLDNADFASYGSAGGAPNASNFAPGATHWALGVGMKHSF
jgi:predicted porin